MLRYPAAFLALAPLFVFSAEQSPEAKHFDQTVRPVLAEYCITCHSTKDQKGDLDLERFQTLEDVMREPEIWQKALDQMADGEMPPKNKPQLSAEQKHALTAWIGGTMEAIGRKNAGDPGPVVLRRLSNAEYTYTLRDLTGVESLDPAREFPVDGAAGEGFTNAGAALVMSPALLTKYLDAAKSVTEHAVLLPDGIAFSEKTTQRDWTEEKLAAIRAFYARFCETGGAQTVNLQGIQFDTNTGGRLPLERYLEATLAEREALTAGTQTIAAVAAKRNLNAKYLGLLWQALTASEPSLLLDMIRAQWRAAQPGQAAALVSATGEWQKVLWRFTTVGHIGKKDGPKAWQVPVSPLAARQDLRLKLPPSKDGKEVTFYLAVSNAGDGAEHDFAVWESPRLVAPGRPDLPLRDVRKTVRALAAFRESLFAETVACLQAAAEAAGSTERADVASLAKKHGAGPAALTAWLEYLGAGGGPVKIDSHLRQKSSGVDNRASVSAWAEADALSVVANAGDEHLRIPGNLKPHSVAVHPSPKLKVAAGWQSPAAMTVQVSGSVQHAHPECGNGTAWTLELRRGTARQRLASGITRRAEAIPFGPFPNLSVQAGDMLSLVIAPRDGNHSCDLTAVDLTITAGERQWDLAKDVSPDLLAGNPHADRQGNAGVWHFYSEPDNGGGGAQPVIPAGSLLAAWLAAPAKEKPALAAAVQKLLTGTGTPPAAGSPDAALYKELTSLRGPLLAAAGKVLLTQQAGGQAEGAATEGAGPDPAWFGKHPDGSTTGAADLCVQAPSVIEVRLPADLAEGCELVTAGSLHPASGAEGSVQFQILTEKPGGLPGLATGGQTAAGGKGTWSDGDRPPGNDTPVIVADGSAARRRMEAAMEDFRELFPVALCYTKIVPVDEVVTLTLFYREDEPLRRLMLDDAQAAELDRLWSEMHFISQDALTLVDAFEQLWQYATQDADPSAFEPMREPIRQRAAAFRQLQTATEPAHVEAVLRFADKAWRKAVSDEEKAELRGLYQKLRAQEMPHEAAVRMMLARVLVAPAFLYRGERAPEGVQSRPVADEELAVRLSYFLWSSGPDQELRALAAAGKLSDPEVLAAQARRMVKSSGVRRLATEFGCQWLHVRDVATLDEKSERHFPTFTGVRAALQEEAVRFFIDLFQQDVSVLSLLDADHSFVNKELAAHYGLSGVEGDGWQRVEGMRARGRGGILGLGATLAKQSGASRTSPILRGNWLCEVVLGERLPRPPKDVPVLPEEAPQGLTERQLTERHTSDANCAGCHARIDPFGFALEGFDAIGRARQTDAAGLTVNTRVKLAGGTEFEGLEGLRRYLLTVRRDDFVRQFCRKLLGYALGRGVLLSDRPLLEEMEKKLHAENWRAGAAVEAIVRSRQFREVRGKDMAVN